MGEAIVITSGKGGVGKTTTSANLGIALAIQGKKVCLVDTDIGLRNLDVIMGLDQRIIYDLVDLIKGRCKMHQALVKDKRFDDLLFLLPAAQITDKTVITPEEMTELIHTLKQDFDYIIIDCPAGIEQGFKNAVAGADHSIVVTTPETAAVRDADRVVGLLQQHLPAKKPMLVINRIRPHMMKDKENVESRDNGERLDIEGITRFLDLELIGIVVDDDNVIKASNQGKPIALDPKNPASIAYRNIARRILGESVPLEKMEQSQPGMFSRLKKIFSGR
ncbi:septum site-determining protein MinD [Bacillus sp. 1P06AnD]|uniref:septum site-determining protein MinD n=1 Tax=Bacillus sp. 1P06AnD TaxID=3132208 RepID=UPI0039A11BA4